MYKSIALAAIIGATFVSNAYADCIVHYNRTACPGQESASYSKCGGSKECDKDEFAATEAECIAAAKAACPNSRLDITSPSASRLALRANR